MLLHFIYRNRPLVLRSSEHYTCDRRNIPVFLLFLFILVQPFDRHFVGCFSPVHNPVPDERSISCLNVKSLASPLSR